MSEFEWKPGGDVSTGGGWASEPGWYHVLITNMIYPPVDGQGQLISDCAFVVDCEIVEGTDKSQIGKSRDIRFYLPKSTDKNEGAFAKKKIDRFFVSVDLATEEQIINKVAIKPDLTQAVGHQFYVHLEKPEGKTYLQLAYSDVFHIDDPAVKDYPKSVAFLEKINPKFRHIGARPAPAAKKEPAPEAKPATPQEVASGWDDV